MTPLDKRQKRLLAMVLGAVALAALLLLIPLLASGEGDPPAGEDTAPVAAIPEADLPDGEGSKIGSYRHGSISDYWDALEAEEGGSEGDAPSAITPGLPSSAAAPAAAPSRKRREGEPVDVEALFGEYQGGEPPVEKTPTPSPPRHGTSVRKRGSAPRDSASRARAPIPEAVPDSTAAAPSPAEALPPRSSGPVPTLDGGAFTELGNAFSSPGGAGGAAEPLPGKPCRCMFTRNEKVRGGQRITLRLLEDMSVGGVTIPRNTHLQGVATITGRLEIRLSSLDMGGRILTFHLEAYDTDGGRGIYCSDLSKPRQDAVSQGLSTLSSTLSSRLGRVARDAASLGASIVRDRAGEATVSVPAGYTFYLIEQTR